MNAKPLDIVLLSGGLDSAVCLALALEQADVVALSVDYGQRHKAELERAKALASHYGVEHIVARLELPLKSPLTGGGEVPKGRAIDDMTSDIAPTYVPGRNSIFAAMACSLAESRGARAVWVGVNAVDFSGYPDCRPAWVDIWRRLQEVTTERGVQARAVQVRAPLLHIGKPTIGKRAKALNVPVELTLSCYDPNERGEPCSTCDACVLRAKALAP